MSHLVSWVSSFVVLFCLWLCFCFWLGLLCLVLEDTWPFAFTYSPTCGNSLSKTIRFDDRQSLERERHELKKKASEHSLLCVPYLNYYALMVVNPLPRQHIHLIQSLETQSADPLTWKLRSSLLRKPCSTAFPLLPDPVCIWSLVRIFKPTRLFPILFGERGACIALGMEVL